MGHNSNGEFLDGRESGAAIILQAGDELKSDHERPHLVDSSKRAFQLIR